MMCYYVGMIDFDSKLVNEHGFQFLAFSGGIDSIVFSHFLRQGNRDFILLHFNHNLIPEDILIERKVNEYAKQMRFDVLTGDPIVAKGIAKGESVEAYCRENRYDFFDNVGGSGNILLCHHLSDAVENYMFNCIRGTPEYLPIHPVVQRKNNKIIRPFLKTSKTDIEEYATKHDLWKYVAEDPLNQDQKKVRNWLRKTVIPEIQTRFNLETVVKKMYDRKIS